MKVTAAAILVVALVTFNSASLVDAKRKGKNKMRKLQEKMSDLEEKVVNLEGSIAALSLQITPLTKLPSIMEKAGEALKGNVQHCGEKTCPEGWVEFQQFCYHFVNQKLSWTKAKENCHALGGYLAEVKDQKANEFLFKLISSTGKSGDGPYIGGQDKKKDGEWYWDHSGEKISYTNWNPGEPNGGASENCLHFRTFSGPGWNDVPCDNFPATSICERKME